jgi:hypothetical protein
MALTSTEKNKIAQLLGYPAIALNSTSVAYDKIFADRLTLIDTDTENLVRGYLDQITALETQMSAAPTRLISSQVADIKINLEELEGLRRERKRIAKELGAFLMLPYRAAGGPNVGVVC